MKSIRKSTRNIDWDDVALKVIFIMLVTLWVVLIVCGFADVKTKNESEIEFVEAVKYGELDTGDTLFMLEDGNLFAFRAHFREKNGHRFLVKINTNGTEDRTDDELIELWANPQVEYDIEWAE